MGAQEEGSIKTKELLKGLVLGSWTEWSTWKWNLNKEVTARINVLHT